MIKFPSIPLSQHGMSISISIGTAIILALLKPIHIGELWINVIVAVNISTIIRHVLDVFGTKLIHIKQKTFQEKLLYIWTKITSSKPTLILLLIHLIITCSFQISINWPEALFLTMPQSLLYALDLESTELSSLKRMQEMGLDCGSMLAHHYFYGYLLHCLNSDNESLEDKIETYENSNNIKIRHKKLFLLITKSGYIPQDLKELSNGIIECAKPLIPIEKDVAGVRRRKYQNPVYKLKYYSPMFSSPEGGPFYIVLEGVSSLLTQYTCIQQSNTVFARFAKEYYQDISRQFYISLKELVASYIEINKRIELIFYDDENETDLGNMLIKKYFSKNNIL